MDELKSRDTEFKEVNGGEIITMLREETAQAYHDLDAFKKLHEEEM
jgi:hypothetical protein